MKNQDLVLSSFASLCAVTPLSFMVAGVDPGPLTAIIFILALLSPLIASIALKLDGDIRYKKLKQISLMVTAVGLILSVGKFVNG